jgi:hypothetical protein
VKSLRKKAEVEGQLILEIDSNEGVSSDVESEPDNRSIKTTTLLVELSVH